MELHCKLDAESVRKLALRLYGEEALKADPAGVVFATVSWIDRVLDNSEPPVPGKPRNDIVRQLTEVVNRKGVANIASELRVSIAAIRSWQRGGVLPTASNLEKIKACLKSQSPASDAAGTADTLKPGEFSFGQQQEAESAELSKLNPNPSV